MNFGAISNGYRGPNVVRSVSYFDGVEQGEALGSELSYFVDCIEHGEEPFNNGHSPFTSSKNSGGGKRIP